MAAVVPGIELNPAAAFPPPAEFFEVAIEHAVQQHKLSQWELRPRASLARRALFDIAQTGYRPQTHGTPLLLLTCAQSLEKQAHVGNRQRPAQQVTLRLIALVLLQVQHLTEILHTLCDDAEADRLRHLDDGGYESPVLHLGGDRGHERSVDLESVDR
jgi:hypothetical protein